MKRQILRVIYKSRNGVSDSWIVTTFFRPDKQIRSASMAKVTEPKRFVDKNHQKLERVSQPLREAPKAPNPS
jgi:hypothetical protein